MPEPFAVFVFDKDNTAVATETVDEPEVSTAEGSIGVSESTTVYSLPGGPTVQGKGLGVVAEHSICRIRGMPDFKTEMWHKKIKIPFDGTKSIPYPHVYHRTCDTEFVAMFRVDDSKLVPLVLECAIPAAAAAAAILIAGAGTPPAIAAALTSFSKATSGCMALKGVKNAFDVKIEERKLCGAWQP